jgi:hypothetical protein
VVIRQPVKPIAIHYLLFQEFSSYFLEEAAVLREQVPHAGSPFRDEILDLFVKLASGCLTVLFPGQRYLPRTRVGNVSKELGMMDIGPCRDNTQRTSHLVTDGGNLEKPYPSESSLNQQNCRRKGEVEERVCGSYRDAMVTSCKPCSSTMSYRGRDVLCYGQFCGTFRSFVTSYPWVASSVTIR